ncbi:hypothetical protein BLX87_23165 [Bacillus sp. VT-16-64]|nr:hypothetical protein BLX87_23165 [Bacillus sp. VT-16-64]
MQIELYIEGKKKLFTAPFVPMAAKRKYLEIEAAAETKAKGDEKYIPPAKDQLEEEAEMVGILADIVFQGQFTVEQVFNGASDEYVYSKLREAVFGKPKLNKDGNEGNEQGK